MADLAAVDRVRVVEQISQDTLPATVATGPGIPCYADSNGKAAKGDASAAGTAGVIGINISPNATLANQPANLVRRGKMVLFDSSGNNILASLAYGALVYLSDTEGRLADAAGTVSVTIGRVLPLWDNDPPTKMLDFDLV